MKSAGAFLSTISALLALTACGENSKKSEVTVTTQPHPSSQPVQKITVPNEADQARLTKQRAVVEQYLADDDSRWKYQTTVAGKLGTIRAILDGKVFAPNQTYQLQCLGIVLGDAFVQDLKMEWVMVEDEYGRDPAVRMPGTTIIAFPMTMISKRIERGESVDIFAFYNLAAADILKRSKDPDYKSP